MFTVQMYILEYTLCKKVILVSWSDFFKVCGKVPNGESLCVLDLRVKIQKLEIKFQGCFPWELVTHKPWKPTARVSGEMLLLSALPARYCDCLVSRTTAFCTTAFCTTAFSLFQCFSAMKRSVSAESTFN